MESDEARIARLVEEKALLKKAFAKLAAVVEKAVGQDMSNDERDTIREGRELIRNIGMG